MSRLWKKSLQNIEICRSEDLPILSFFEYFEKKLDFGQVFVAKPLLVYLQWTTVER